MPLEDELPTLLQDMLPAGGAEPPIPNILPDVRAGGIRRRRRRRLAIGVATLAVGAVLAGATAGAFALVPGDGGHAGSGPAAAPTATITLPSPASSSPALPSTAWLSTAPPDENFILDRGPIHDRVLAALRANLPAGITKAVDQAEGDKTLFFLLTRTDGSTLTFDLTSGEATTPGGRPQLPCELGPQIDNKTGQTNTLDWTDCAGAVLPDGAKAITATLPTGRDKSVFLDFITPAGISYSFTSSNRDKFGTILNGSPLTAADLVTLASTPAFRTALPAARPAPSGEH
ncbi:hypothetical protein [Embleya sp. AB8]|uniref:hypothetical protein n=1 Tax=Embleya sp. AB8 TaxID=3156304 RepID=UPI003C732139